MAAPALSGRCFAFTLPQHHHLVGRRAGKNFLVSIRPNHLDGLHAGSLAHAKVGARIVAALEAVAGIDPTVPAPAAGLDANLRSVGIPTAQRRIERPNHQPVSALRGDVAVKTRGGPDRSD